ncbi:tetratricopeptide repeat-like superfamily protein [Tanacetum coccineum]
MMMNRTKSAVDGLLKLRFKCICISTRSFAETPFSDLQIGLESGPPSASPIHLNPWSSNVDNYDDFVDDIEMLEEMTREVPPAIFIISLCDNPDKTMMDDALKLFQEMVSQPDVVTYNSLVSGLYAHCVNGERDKARSLANYMVSNHHLAPDTATYTSLLNGYCNDYDKMDDAMLIYHEMNEKEKELLAEALSLYDLLGEDSKLNSDMSVLLKLMHGAIKCDKLDFARKLFEGLSVRGIKPIPRIYTTMIFGFCEEGLVNDAKRLFLEMEENHCWPTTDTYNYLLQGYLKNKFYDDVKMLLHRMEEKHHYLYESTLSMLRASVAAGSLDATLSNLINKLA